MTAVELCQNANGLMEVCFSREACQQLEEAFSQPINLASHVDRQIAFAQSVLARVIGAEELAGLARLASLEVGEGATLFHIPYDQGVSHAPRPGEPAHLVKPTGIVERMLLALSQPYGYAYANRSEDKEVIGHLIPRPEAVNAYTGEGSRRELSFHPENAAWRYMHPGFDLAPRAILLAGIAAQRAGGPDTPIGIVSRAVRLMDATRANRLRRPCAYLLLPYRNRVENGLNRVGPVPILLGAPGREECCGAFYPGMVEFDHAADQEAFVQLGAALKEVAIPLRIVPGLCAAISNGAVVHARSGFVPAFNAEGRAERWVERLFTHARPESLMHFAHNGERVFNLSPPT